MKNLNFIAIIIFACIIISGCKKDKLDSIDDLEIQIDLLDTNYVSTRDFRFGADMIFRYTETNKTKDTIYYYNSFNCPTFLFVVYKENDSLYGDAIPYNWACTFEMDLLQLAPHASRVAEINWFNDTTNTALPVGNYKLKFNNSISIPEIKESKTYNLEIKFKVI
jgi:hypothetical protein